MVEEAPSLAETAGRHKSSQPADVDQNRGSDGSAVLLPRSLADLQGRVAKEYIRIYW